MIRGFEQDVGTRTSFYGFTVNTMKNSLITYQNMGFTSVPQGQVHIHRVWWAGKGKPGWIVSGSGHTRGGPQDGTPH